MLSDPISLTRPGLRGILTGTLAVLTAALILSVTAVVVWTATRETQRSIGRSLGDLAAFMREALESDVYERWRSMRTLSTLPAFTNAGASYQGRRIILDRVKSNVEEIVWIGLADMDGRVIVASGGEREGSSVADRRWFAAARARTAPSNGQQERPTVQTTPGERVVEIGVHLRDNDGQSVGIMGMLVSWDWLGHLRRSLIDRSQGRQSDLEVIVLDRDGRVVIGDPAHLGAGLARRTADRSDGFQIDTLPDGRTMVIGTSRASGGRNIDGLGWQIVVTSNAEVAFAPVRELRRQIVAAGGIVGLMVLIAGWWVAGRIASPLQSIAARADRVGLADALDGVVIEVPKSSSQEIVSLAASLQGMIDRLADNEEALRHLANTLEHRVADRTAELETANRALSAARDDAVAATAPSRASSPQRAMTCASHSMRCRSLPMRSPGACRTTSSAASSPTWRRHWGRCRTCSARCWMCHGWMPASSSPSRAPSSSATSWSASPPTSGRRPHPMASTSASFPRASRSSATRSSWRRSSATSSAMP